MSLEASVAITVTWKVEHLKKLLDKADETVKESRSPAFDDGRWFLTLGEHNGEKDWLAVFLWARFQTNERDQRGACLRTPQHAMTFELLASDTTTVLHGPKKTEAVVHSCAPGASDYGWGFGSFVARDAKFLVEGKCADDDAVFLRCTITPSGFNPTAPLLPSLITAKLASAYESFFGDTASCDVRFIVNSGQGVGKKELFAHSRVLAAQSSYFKTMFSAGFAESSSPRSAEAQQALPAQAACAQWDGDDDALDWLPIDWLKRHPLPSEEAKSFLDEASGVSGKTSGVEKQTIVVTDAGYSTYRALLFFLYSGRVGFTPLASSFLVEILRNELAIAVTSDGTFGSDSDSPSRRTCLLAQTEKTGISAVDPASPHAMYRLADKLDLPELKEKAKEAIVKGFTVDNILYELVSTFSYQYGEVQDAARAFALAHWDELKTTPSFSRVVHACASGTEIEGAGEIWEKLLERLTAPPQSK